MEKNKAKHVAKPKQNIKDPKQRKALFINLAVITAVLVFAAMVLLHYTDSRNIEPDDAFAAFIEKIKSENINVAAADYISDPSLVNLNEDSFSYQLFEIIKENISYSFVAKSLVNENDTAFISVNITSCDINALVKKTEALLGEDEVYIALVEPERRLTYKRSLLIEQAKVHCGEYLIINTVKVGFSHVGNEWKIIPDPSLLRALVGADVI